jgi:nucleoside-diphosphate-sugar epimerase
MNNIVVVTGASGFIGSHIVSNLLLKGRNVRATVRDLNDSSRVSHLRKLPINDNGSLVIIEMDLFDTNSVDDAINGAIDVIHTAAAVIIRSKNPQRDIVDPSIIGTQNVLNAIERSGSVKNYVHTSSTAAIRPASWTNGEILTSETYADDAKITTNPYGLAKYSAEMLVRDWYNNMNPEFRPRMITIHPCMVFGPPLSPRHLHGSLAIIMMLVKRKLPVLLPMQISIVDVRDVAEIHVLALNNGKDGGRYLTVAGEMMMAEMADVLRESYPTRKWPKLVLPYKIAIIISALHPKVSISWARTHLKNKLYWNSEPASKDFKIIWRNPKDTITETIPNIIDNNWD